MHQPHRQRRAESRDPKKATATGGPVGQGDSNTGLSDDCEQSLVWPNSATRVSRRGRLHAARCRLHCTLQREETCMSSQVSKLAVAEGLESARRYVLETWHRIGRGILKPRHPDGLESSENSMMQEIRARVCCTGHRGVRGVPPLTSGTSNKRRRELSSVNQAEENESGRGCRTDKSDFLRTCCDCMKYRCEQLLMAR